MAESLLSEQSGLFGALSEMVSDDQFLLQLSQGVAKSLVVAKAPNTFSKYEPLVRGGESYAAMYGKGEPAFPADPALFVLY